MIMAFKNPIISSMSDPKGYFTPDEVKRFIDNTRSQRDKLLITLLALTGHRITTILELKVKDINWGKGYILWNLLKPRRRKWLPVSNKALLELKKFILNHDLKEEDYVFRSSHNLTKPISDRRCRQIITEIGKKIGITEVGEKGGPPHPHHFRHSFSVKIAQLIKNPADAKKLSDLRGDINPWTVFNSYMQFSRTDLKELVDLADKADGLFNEGGELLEKVTKKEERGE
jgi:integrase